MWPYSSNVGNVVSDLVCYEFSTTKIILFRGRVISYLLSIYKLLSKVSFFSGMNTFQITARP